MGQHRGVALVESTGKRAGFLRPFRYDLRGAKRAAQGRIRRLS